MEDLLLVRALWINEQIRYFLFDNLIISLEEARTFVKESLETFQQYGYGLWLVYRGNDAPLGFAGLLRSPPPNLIYGVHPYWWGQGYATEAASAVLSYSSKLVTRVRADVDEPNRASVRVLEKLGLKRTGQAEVQGRSLLYFESHSIEPIWDLGQRV